MNRKSDRRSPEPSADARTLLGVLRSAHASLRREGRIAALLAGLATAGAGLALLQSAERLLWLDPWIRGAWLLLLVAAVGIVLARVRRGVRTEPFEAFYRLFGSETGLDRLRDGVDLLLDPAARTPLGRYAVRQNLEDTSPQRLRRELALYRRGRAERRRLRLWAGIALPVMLLSAALLRSDPDATSRTAAFWQSFERPNPWSFTLAPADTTVEYGSRLTPEVRFGADAPPPPQQVRLALRSGSSERFRERPMRRVDERTFRAEPIEMISDTDWEVRMEGFSGERRQVLVRLLPAFESLRAVVDPPSYTGLDPEERIYPFARIRALTGSRITLQGELNRPPDSLSLSIGDRVLAMEPAEGTDEPLSRIVSFEAGRTDTATIYLRDGYGLEAAAPYRFEIERIEDEAPAVTILSPEEDRSVGEEERLGIRYRAADDFGLTRAELQWELLRAFTDSPQEGSMPLERPARDETESFEWDLSGLELRPRDRVAFRIVVWDNDRVSGPKPGRSRTVTLEVPSMGDRMEQIAGGEERSRERLDRIRERYSQMQDDYDRLRERLRRNPEPGWDERQIADDLRESHRDVEEEIRSLNEEFEELRREIESGGRVSEQTRQAYRELQQLFEELDDPDMLRALEELRRAMAELDPRNLESALEQFEFNEELYRQRIERTLELFRSLRMNSALDRLAAQYEELSEAFGELADGEAEAEERHRRLRSLRSDSEALAEPLDRLTEQAPQRALERLEAIREEASGELQNLLGRMDRQIERGAAQAGTQEARSMHGETAQTMADRAESLRQARQEIGGRQLQVNLLALERSLYWLLQLSGEQETLSLHASETESRSQGFVELARRQENIRGQFSQVADTLLQIASEIPQLSAQINRRRAETGRTLETAVSFMSERERRNASLASVQALGGINELASMLAGVVDQLRRQQQEGGGGGMSMEQMIDQLQNLTGEQLEMNRRLEELINDIQGERLTRDESEQLEELARRQNEIRRQIRRLQQSGVLRPGDATLSELERAAEEMAESINEMRGGLADPLMNDRQLQILSRMLRVEESLQQQGESEEYAGERPGEIDAPAPEQWSLDQIEQELRTRLQDPRYTRFRQEYQELIERYFDRIRRLER